MVRSFVRRLLERDHFQRIFHNEDGCLIAATVFAHGAPLEERHHLTLLAVPDLGLEFEQCFPEALGGSFRTPEEMERKTLRRLRPDAGELGELLDCFLDLMR